MILDNLDEEATCANAKKLLRSFHRMERMAGRTLTALQSSKMDGIPRTPSIENHNEERIHQRLIAEQEFKAILVAVNSLDDDSRSIINGQYILHSWSNIRMADELGMSSTTFDNAKKAAIIAFAELFAMKNYWYSHDAGLFGVYG